MPGILVRRFYFTGVFSKQFHKGQLLDRLINTVFWGIISQVITLMLLYSSDFENRSQAYNISKILNGEANFLDTISFNILSSILIYLIVLIIVSIFIGYLAYWTVRILKLDIISKSIRFSNKWHYYFSGETLNKDGFTDHKKNVAITNIDITLQNFSNSKNKMIQGVLTQYHLDPKNDNLELLFLSHTRRFSNTTNQFEDIPGEIFVVPYSNVVDMNIRYIYEDESQDDKKYHYLGELISYSIIIFYVIIPWIFTIGSLNIFKIIGFYVFGLLFISSFLNLIKVLISNRLMNGKKINNKKISLLLLITLTLLSLIITLNMLNIKMLEFISANLNYLFVIS